MWIRSSLRHQPSRGAHGAPRFFSFGLDGSRARRREGIADLYAYMERGSGGLAVPYFSKGDRIRHADLDRGPRVQKFRYAEFEAIPGGVQHPGMGSAG